VNLPWGHINIKAPRLPAFPAGLTNSLSLREPFHSGSGLHRSFENWRFSWSRETLSLGRRWFRTIHF